MLNIKGHLVKIHWITSLDDLNALFEALYKSCYAALDIETYADIPLDQPVIDDLLLVRAQSGGLSPYSSNIRLIQIYPFFPKFEKNTTDYNTVFLIDYSYCESNHPEILEVLKRYLFSFSAFNITWVGHNIKFDFLHLMHKGFEINTYDIQDTMLISKVMNSGKMEFFQSSLEDCVKRAFDIHLDKSYQTSDWSPAALPVIKEEYLSYAVADVFFTAKLFLSFTDYCNTKLRIHQRGSAEYKEIIDLMRITAMEGACTIVTAEMELYGFGVDLDKFNEYSEENYENLMYSYSELVSQIPAFWFNVRFTIKDNRIVYELFGEPNLNSVQDVLNILQRSGVRNPETGELLDSTDKKLLSQSDHPIVKALLSYRNNFKIHSTYTESLRQFVNPFTQRIHSTFNQIGAPTGRFSSTSPNIQNLPRTSEFRKLFKASKGYKLIVADYSQIEVRVSACISKDQELISIFRNKQDLYKSVASKIYEIPYDEVTKEVRQRCKAVVLGFQYGMGAKKFKTYFNGFGQEEIDVEQSEEIRKAFFSKFQGLEQWHNRVKNATRSNARVFKTFSLYGRRRLFTDRQSLSFSAMVNSPVQGTSADITKYALIYLHQYLSVINRLYQDAVNQHKKDAPLPLRKAAIIVNCVHDEVILEVAEELAESLRPLINWLMEFPAIEVMKDVPVTVESSVVDSWAEK